MSKEVPGENYARLEATWDEIPTVSFTPPTMEWGTVTSVALYDSAPKPWWKRDLEFYRRFPFVRFKSHLLWFGTPEKGETMPEEDKEELEKLQAVVRLNVISLVHSRPEEVSAHVEELANSVPWPDGNKPGWSSRS